MKLKRRVYFDLETGAIVEVTGGFYDTGFDEQPTIDWDFEVYQRLAERVRNKVGVIELEQGEYDDDFAQGILSRVDPETMHLYFTYPDTSEPGDRTPELTPLTERIKVLEDENNLLREKCSSLSERADFIEECITKMEMKV
ncbi:hypothetical protein [Paenibacillus cellulositrophicus]|uniref:hypothetical protein n=1 Tax=Paenibacillus cellulositrophicus TaxID=562959 RepID=UPI003D9943D3